MLPLQGKHRKVNVTRTNAGSTPWCILMACTRMISRMVEMIGSDASILLLSPHKFSC